MYRCYGVLQIGGVKMKKYKTLIACILIPLLVGVLAWLLSGGTSAVYDSIIKAPLSPPAWVFPIIWTILYILMGVSSYLVLESDCRQREKTLAVYALQLAVNFFWPLIFFRWQMFFLAFVWLVLLWVLVYIMIVRFFKCSKTAAYLQIPYLLWITFAGCLNFMIWVLNR